MHVMTASNSRAFGSAAVEKVVRNEFNAPAGPAIQFGVVVAGGCQGRKAGARLPLLGRGRRDVGKDVQRHQRGCSLRGAAPRASRTR